MKIIGFSQLRNELSNQNLENWFRCMEFCDFIYIYDQDSTDGSKEYYKNYPNTVVIESPVNDFEREISCKDILLTKLLREHPDVDWIFWIDGDTILDGRLLKNDAKEIRYVLKKATEHKIDTLVLGHYNLWRSDLHHRVDNDYDWFHKNGRRVFWRNNGHLKFVDNGGLHQPQYPHGLHKQARIDRNLIHRGFATDEQIINRHRLYKSKGQSGPSLDRLLDENTLEVQEVPPDVFPEWYKFQNMVDPNNKVRLADNEK